MHPQCPEDFDQQTDRVIPHHKGNDRRDRRIKPVKAIRHVDDGTGQRDSGRSRGVAGGIKKDGTHVQVAAGLVVAVVAAVTATVTVTVTVEDEGAEDEGADEHHDGGNPADDENRRPVNLAGAEDELSGRARQNRDAQDEQPAGIYPCGPRGGHGVPVWTFGLGGSFDTRIANKDTPIAAASAR